MAWVDVKYRERRQVWIEKLQKKMPAQQFKRRWIGRLLGGGIEVKTGQRYRGGLWRKRNISTP